MRILFISTFYPPYVVGGWEQLVQEINDHLRARGHATHVLTSTHGVDAPSQEPGVDRVLTLEGDLYHYRPLSTLSYPARLRRNLQHTRDAIDTFQPDVVFIHIMWNLSRGIAWTAEQLCPGRVVYYVADYWPYETDVHTQYWRDPAAKPLAKLLKQCLAPLSLALVHHQDRRFPLAFKKVLCVSHAVQDALAARAGIPSTSMEVVYNGVDTRQFQPRMQRREPRENGLKLVYAGSLVPHKGVHTTIQALGELRKQGALQGITLTLIGAGHPSYEERLRTLVADLELEHNVHFMGRVPRERMPDLLPQFDALLFPSTWDEPLARIVQEAMACGLAVIGTPTGGTPEILIDGVTGFVFEAENPQALADRILQLARDPELLAKMGQTARDLVVERFDIRRMIDEIEEQLTAVAALATARNGSHHS